MRGVKFRATLWKCYRQRRYHYILTTSIVVLPIILCILVLILKKALYQVIEVNRPIINPKKSISDILESNPLNIAETELLYSPSTKFTDDLMRNTQVNLGVPNDKIKSFASEEKLISHYKAASASITYGVVFKNIGSGVPDRLNYEIRHYGESVDFKTEKLYKEFNGRYYPDFGANTYYEAGFLSLQLQIDTNYMTIKNQNKEIPIKLTLQEFPSPPYKFNWGNKEVIKIFLPLLTLMSFILILPSSLLRILHEKESGIKELMKMMGLTPIALWFCLFIDALVPYLISIVCIVLLLKYGVGSYPKIMEYSDGFILFLFFVLYCTATIALYFFVSTLTNQAKYGSVIATLVSTISYSITSLFSNFELMPWYQVMIFYLFPNCIMVYVYRSFSTLEDAGLGSRWSNLFVTPTGLNAEIKIGIVLLSFIIQTIGFLLLTLYMNLVRPGKYGVGKSYAFPLAYVSLKFRKRRNSVHVMEEQEDVRDYVKIEKSELPVGVNISNLRKEYGNKTALHKLSINFYKGEITVLLGHNGAGKTTMMSILTGLLQATSGSVVINGRNLVDDVEVISNMMGICPQHDMLFEDLNVWEHLKFFAMLKQVDGADEKINTLIQKLNIAKNRYGKQLSGGGKRKLCLGMAMILNPQILILDEPTSGLDPKSRREIWDLLLNWQRNKVDGITLISTHVMEEADALGDRVAVLDGGILVAYGTPMFLKNEYDTGHKLTLVTKHEKFGAAVHNTVTKNMPDAQLVLLSNNIRTYLLPNDKKHLYSQLIQTLENQRDSLEIESITIRVTSLEDVFLKITKLVDKNDKEDRIPYDITTAKECEPPKLSKYISNLHYIQSGLKNRENSNK